MPVTIYLGMDQIKFVNDRQSLDLLKLHDLVKQTVSLQIF